LQDKLIPRKPALIVFTILSVMVVVIDQITKDLAEKTLGLSGSSVQPFIPGLLDFRLAYNTGAAWGILKGGRVYFVIVAVVTVAAVLVYLITTKSHPTLVVFGLGIFVGGSIGNAIDRAISGRVVDFLNFLFIDFPVFNIADCGITIGAAFVLISIALGYINDRRMAAAGVTAEADLDYGDKTRSKAARTGEATRRRGEPARTGRPNQPLGRHGSNAGAARTTSRAVSHAADSTPTVLPSTQESTDRDQ